MKKRDSVVITERSNRWWFVVFSFPRVVVFVIVVVPVIIIVITPCACGSRFKVHVVKLWCILPSAPWTHGMELQDLRTDAMHEDLLVVCLLARSEGISVLW